MKLAYLTVAGAGIALFAASQANGAAISVTFNANRTLGAAEQTGAEAVVGNWNNILVTGGPNGTWSSLQDSTGTTTATSITTASWGGIFSMSTDGSPFIKLYEAGLAKEGDIPVGSATITLSNIPYANYDIYIYYSHFPIGSDTLQTWSESQNGSTIYGTNNKFHGHDWGDFVQYQTSDRATAVAQAQTAGPDGGGNWLKFTGLSDSTITLTSSDQNLPEVTVNGFNISYVQRGIAGLQIVEAIPEPSVLGLIALAPALAFRRRRA